MTWKSRLEHHPQQVSELFLSNEKQLRSRGRTLTRASTWVPMLRLATRDRRLWAAGVRHPDVFKSRHPSPPLAPAKKE